MELTECFRQIADGNTGKLIVCGLDHTILYMNPAACRDYADEGGEKLVGTSLMQFHTPHAAAAIGRILAWFAEDAANNCVFVNHNEKLNADNYMCALRGRDGKLTGYYERQELRGLHAGLPYEEMKK